MRQEGSVVIVPVCEEIMVMTEQLVLRGYLHIQRVVTTREISEPVALRCQYATAEFLDRSPLSSAASTMKDTDNG